MGCQCAHSDSEAKSELINLNSKEMIENNFMKENNDINILKSSVSDSVYNNFQNVPNINKESIPINKTDDHENYKNYSQKVFELIIELEIIHQILQI